MKSDTPMNPPPLTKLQSPRPEEKWNGINAGIIFFLQWKKMEWNGMDGME